MEQQQHHHLPGAVFLVLATLAMPTSSATPSPPPAAPLDAESRAYAITLVSLLAACTLLLLCMGVVLFQVAQRTNQILERVDGILSHLKGVIKRPIEATTQFVKGVTQRINDKVSDLGGAKSAVPPKKPYSTQAYTSSNTQTTDVKEKAKKKLFDVFS